MNRRKFFKAIGLTAAVSTVEPSVWIKLFAKFIKPKPTPLYNSYLRAYAKDEVLFRHFALRQANPVSILKVIQEKFNKPPMLVYDWKFRYPEFDEIPLK